MERKPLPDWCVVGAPAALLTDDHLPRVTLVTINKVNKVSVTVAVPQRGGDTVVSVARGLTYAVGTWGRTTELLSAGDPRVMLVLARQRRDHTVRIVQEALADWAATGDDASLQIAVMHLAPYVAADAFDRT